jgi:uncharacterized protein (DUF58 family)
MVDWKSTAHTGNLQVREFSQERRRTVELYLDCRVPPGWNDWFEGAVESCAFLAWHLSERDIALWFRSQRFSRATPEEGEVYDVLKYLAMVEPMAGGARDQPAEAPLDASSIRIAFSARPGEFEAEGWISAQG